MMFIASIITCIVFCRENILIVYKNSMEEIYKINLGMNFVTIAFLYRNWSVPHFFATSTMYLYVYIYKQVITFF